MSDFVSEVKTIPYNEEKIFSLLSDMSNLERVKDRMPQDKIKNFTFDRDMCSFTVDPVGSVVFEIVEREPYKTIKFSTTNSPIPLLMWIQLKPTGENETKMKMTVRAELMPFLKPMVTKPLQDAVDKISDVIAGLPYD